VGDRIAPPIPIVTLGFPDTPLLGVLKHDYLLPDYRGNRVVDHMHGGCCALVVDAVIMHRALPELVSIREIVIARSLEEHMVAAPARTNNALPSEGESLTAHFVQSFQRLFGLVVIESMLSKSLLKKIIVLDLFLPNLQTRQSFEEGLKLAVASWGSQQEVIITSVSKERPAYRVCDLPYTGWPFETTTKEGALWK